MRSHALYLPALVVAALGAAVVALSAFVQPLRAALVHPLTLIEGAVTVALFLRMLFDPQCRRGIDAANIELRAGRPWPSGRGIKFADPEWGLFGSRSGNRPLQVIRALL